MVLPGCRREQQRPTRNILHALPRVEVRSVPEQRPLQGCDLTMGSGLAAGALVTSPVRGSSLKVEPTAAEAAARADAGAVLVPTQARVTPRTATPTTQPVYLWAGNVQQQGQTHRQWMVRAGKVQYSRVSKSAPHNPASHARRVIWLRRSGE